MAITFRGLAERIAKNDHVGFLKSYMQLVIAGKNLTVPTSLDYLPAKKAWEQILYGVPGGDSVEFLVNVTNTWLQAVKQQGGDVTDDFPKEIFDILNGDVPEGKKISEKKIDLVDHSPKQKRPLMDGRPPITAVDVKEVTEKERQKEGDPALSGVAGSISDSYTTDFVLEHTELPSLEKVPQKLQKLMTKHTINDFLILYLTRAKEQINFNVPQSSVMDIIYHQWREILMNEFNSVPSDDFVQALATRWFYLVNQIGLPSSPGKIRNMLQFLIQTTAEANSVSNQTKERSLSDFIDQKGGQTTPQKKKMLDYLSELFK